MKSKFNSESLRPFINMEGLNGDEVVERKRFSSKISISPDEERTVVALISTMDEDSDNDVIIPSGADLKRFTKNPVIHINHSYKVEDVVGKAVALSVQEDGILAKIQFASTPKAEDCWNLVKNGYVSANSIGFLIKEAYYAGTEEFKRFVKENKIKVNNTCRRIISKFELLESSIVSIPANPEALMQAISAKSITLSEDTIKELDLPKVVVIEKIVEPEAPKAVEVVIEAPKAISEDISEVKEEVKTIITEKEVMEVQIEVKEVIPEVIPEVVPVVEVKENRYIKVVRSGGADIEKMLLKKKLALKGRIL